MNTGSALPRKFQSQAASERGDDELDDLKVDFANAKSPVVATESQVSSLIGLSCETSDLRFET